MAFANVSFSDTYATWLLRTNQLVIAYNSLESSNAVTAESSAGAAFGKANTACTQSDQAGTNANNAYGQGNTAYTHANNAYNSANAAVIATNAEVVIARDRANTGVSDAATAQALGVSAFGKANTGVSDAATAQALGVSAFGKANTACTQSDQAGTNANNAYGAANTKLANASTVYVGTLGFASNGTASSPAIQRAGTGNTSTGIYFPSANTIAITTAGNNIIYVAPTGNVGIGTTTTSYKLYVSGDIYATGDITAYSDIAIKKDIVTITDALQTVSNLRGVRYTRRDNDQKKIGLIAQEVQEILPEVVVNAENNIGISYQTVVALLIEAIKELSDKVTKLESR